MAELNSAEHVRNLWRRLETWAGLHAPPMLQSLNGPAADRDILALEEAIGLKLPAAFRTSLMIHNGEDDPWGPSILADDAYMLPIHRILQGWQRGVQYAQENGRYGLEDAQAWAASILDGMIFVAGPVKPMLRNPRWIPLTNCNEDVFRYIDFDPPPGGTPGQIIEVDPEGCSWKVLAPSFFHFLQNYIEGLAQGKYQREEDGAIVSPAGPEPVVRCPLPDYLKDVTFERAGTLPVPSPLNPEALASGQTVTLEGTMGSLQGGGPEIVFTLDTAAGHAYWILASARWTAGFLQIRGR